MAAKRVHNKERREAQVARGEAMGQLLDDALPVGFVRALEADPVPAGGDPPLSDDEAYFAERARAHNTRRAYRADFAYFARWCAGESRSALPAAADNVSGYLTYLARRGAPGAHHEPPAVLDRLRAPVRQPHQPSGHAPGPRRVGGG